MRHEYLRRQKHWLPALGLIWIAAHASAQPLAPLPVATVLGAREFAPYSPVQLSQDGRWLAYTVLRGGADRNSKLDTQLTAGIPWYGLNAEIYVFDRKSGALRDLTAGRDDSFLPRWSPNGRALAFVSDREKSAGARLWLWETESNTFSRLSDRSIAADQLAWTPDGRALIVTTSVEATAPPVKKFGICNGVRVYRSATLSASQVIASTSEAWNR